jgi:phage terminase small subunit
VVVFGRCAAVAAQGNPDIMHDLVKAEPTGLSLEERQERVRALEQEVRALEVAEAREYVGDLSGLTARQKAFVHEYLIDNNATQAAIRAGYTGKDRDSIGVYAGTLLKNPAVSAAIGRAQATRSARLGVHVDHVVNELHILANSDLGDYYISDDGQVKPQPWAPEGCMRAISSIKKRTRVTTDRDGCVTRHYDVELRLWDKPAPLRLLGKHLGMNLSDRVEVTGKDGAPITMIVRQVVEPGQRIVTLEHPPQAALPAAPADRDPEGDV